MSAFKEWLKKAGEPAVILPTIATILVGIMTSIGGGALIGHYFWSNSKSITGAVHINEPGPDSEISRCVQIAGNATLPESYSIWIIAEGFGPASYYPLGTASITSDARYGHVTWSYSATIGADSTARVAYKIYALVVNSKITSYLNDMTIIDSSGHTDSLLAMSASAPELPPNALAQDSVTAIRNGSSNNCHP